MVMLKIDIDQNRALKQKFGVRAIPDLRFLDPDGKEIERYQGDRSAASFVAKFEEISAKYGRPAAKAAKDGAPAEERPSPFARPKPKEPKGPKTAWQTRVAEGLRTLSASGNRVVVAHAAGLHCLDAGNGEEQWKAAITGVVAMATDPERAYVASGGTISALKLADGSKVWETAAGPKALSGLALSGDRLIAAGEDGKVYGVGRAGGGILWTFDKGTPASVTRLIVAGALALVGSQDGKVFAIAAGDGKKSWEFAYSEPIVALSAAKDLVVVAAKGGKVFGIKAADGTKLWEFAGAGTPADAFAFEGAVVVIGEGKVVGLNAAGAIQWEQSKAVLAASAGSKLLVAEGAKLLALNPATGVSTWEFGVSSAPSTRPLAIRGRILIGAGDSVHCIDTGDPRFCD